MKVLEEHRQRVRLLRDQLERLQELQSKIFSARGESWELRSHYREEREDKLHELHARIDDMNGEIELIRETYFPEQPDPAANIPPPGITVAPPEASLHSGTPATDGARAGVESDPPPTAVEAEGTSDAAQDPIPAAADGPAAAEPAPPGDAGTGDAEN